MVNATHNELVMQHVFDELATGNGRPLIDAMADDVHWTLIGTTPWSGTYRGKAAILTELLGPLFEQFADRYTNRPVRFVAQGEHVVIECRGSVSTTRGLRYDNTYCWVCRLHDGRLVELTEYCDTELIATALETPSRGVTARSGDTDPP